MWVHHITPPGDAYVTWDILYIKINVFLYRIYGGEIIVYCISLLKITIYLRKVQKTITN